jgi:hypothetical protein
MDIVSPVQFKKLDFEKFEKVEQVNSTTSNGGELGEPNSEQNSETANNNSNTDIMVPDNYLIFYDRYSKNIIQFKETHIKIFNKNATNLKKTINIVLEKSKINMSAVDKHLKYMLVLLDFKMALIVNLKNEKVSDILHYDFSTILGMFFITQTGSFGNDVDVRFAILFVNKIVYFKITPSNNGTDAVTEVKTVKLGFSAIGYYYNTRYMILGLEKPQDRNFEFYNLSTEKFYTKGHGFHYPVNKNKREGSIGKFFSIFVRSSGNDKGGSLFMDVKNKNLYKKTQFFLETM